MYSRGSFPFPADFPFICSNFSLTAISASFVRWMTCRRKRRLVTTRRLINCRYVHVYVSMCIHIYIYIYIYIKRERERDVNKDIDSMCVLLRILYAAQGDRRLWVR